MSVGRKHGSWFGGLLALVVAVLLSGFAANSALAAPGVDLSITKTGPASVGVGSQITWTITVTDASTGASTGFTVDDAMPPGVSLNSITTGNDLNCLASTQSQLICSSNALAAGASTQISVVATVPSTPGTITNTATVTGNDSDPNPANNSSSLTTEVIGPATHFLVAASTPWPSYTNQSITVTALDAANNVATGYAGTVHVTSTDPQFVDSSGDFTLTNGTATKTVALKTAGTQTITATDTVDSSITGTSNEIIVTPGAATHFAVSAPSTATAGTSFNFTVTAEDLANNVATGYTGTVHFTSTDAGASLPADSTLTNGTGTFSATVNDAGSQTITATDTADSSIHGTSGSIAAVANTTTAVTSSVNPSVFGQSVAFTATVSPAVGTGTPTGTVTFLDGGASIGTGTLSGGVATFTTSALAVGNHTITAAYGGDSSFNTSTGSLVGGPQVVNKADTTSRLTSSSNPSVFGQSVTFTATVQASSPGSGTPAGTVTFLDGGAPIGTGTLSGGVATFTTSALTAGNHTITTNYGGDANFNGSSGSLTGNPQVVGKHATTTTVASSLNPSVYGQSVTFTATVSPSVAGPPALERMHTAVPAGPPAPTGSVTFLDGGMPIGTGTLSGGAATLTTSALAAGNHTITASYAGDGNYSASTGPLTGNPQVVTAASTSTSAANATVKGSSAAQTVNLSAAVSSSAATVNEGTVTFTVMQGSTTVGSTTTSGTVSNGTASVSYALPAATATGSYTIDAVYNPGADFTASSDSTHTLTVVAQNTTPQPPANRFAVADLHVSKHGTVSFEITVPGPGAIQTLVTAWDDNLAKTARVLQPAAMRFVFGRGQASASKASTVHVVVRPNKRGRALLRRHRYAVVLRVWISYTPTHGAQRNEGFRHLLLGSSKKQPVPLT